MLPAEIQLGLRENELGKGQARAMHSIEIPKQQLKLYNRILKEDLSVRRVEELAKEGMEETVKKEKNSPDRNNDYKLFEKELSNYFPLPVKFNRKSDGKGTITLTFANDDELQTLVSLFEKLKS